LADKLTPIPEDFSSEQKLSALRRRETLVAIDVAYLVLCIMQKMKERNLAYTRYELSVFEVVALDTPARGKPE
jgi:hypothetical protein